MVRDDDEAWRAIVDNYGDRAEIDEHDELPETGATDVTDAGDRDPAPAPEPEPAPGPGPSTSWEDPYPDSDWESDRFVPPPPPPVPTTSTDRTVAWAGVLGSPVVLLACLLLGVELPQLIAYLLVIGFVGGFLYLVVNMSREPRDPGDDGAVL